MNRSPFATFVNMVGYLFSVHHSAVIAVVQDNEAEGTHLVVRIGNSGESYKVQTLYDEVMRELERARRAEIVSFGE